ncbi:hypothetical protein D3C86_2123630 [compost metagenome]
MHCGEWHLGQRGVHLAGRLQQLSDHDLGRRQGIQVEGAEHQQQQAVAGRSRAGLEPITAQAEL